MEDFLFPVSQHSVCERMTTSAFVKAVVPLRLSFLHRQTGIMGLFLRSELKLTGHRGEWDFIGREVAYSHIMRTHQKMETVPCKICLTQLLGLLKACAVYVALWIWENLRSAQILFVGLRSRHHQQRWLLKANRRAGNNCWCLLVSDMLSVLTYG